MVEFEVRILTGLSLQILFIYLEYIGSGKGYEESFHIKSLEYELSETIKINKSIYDILVKNHEEAECVYTGKKC